MPGMTPPTSRSHALSDADTLSLPERLEADIIRDTLATHGSNVQQTIAAALGISPKTVYDKLQRHGIVRRDFEGE
ncbi:MAG: hypothetical protein BGN83_19525 [Rhizobium sp. 63-7]|nr:MAG: hypothetical protein BGN83_19525 [Rhizobium sp. 63-7]